MLTRRGFLKGFLASVAAAALVKNGVIRPEQVLAEPEPWTIDMAANTWRQDRYNTIASLLGELPPLRPGWPMMYTSLDTVSFSLSALYVTDGKRSIRIGDPVYVGYPGAQPIVIGRASHIDPIGDQVIVRIRPPEAL